MSRGSESQTRVKQQPLVGNLLVALASLAFTFLFLALVEGALRLSGLGDPGASRSSRLAYQQIQLPTLVPDERPDGTRVLRTNDQRLPYQEILHVKPEKAIRIMTFGGSATAGLGYSPNVTFSRQLERMLEKSHPGRLIEVGNLGIVSLASRQVAQLVEEAVRAYDPDALIVYSGNNEFLEAHAEKFAAAQANPLSALRDHLLDTNLFRIVTRAVRGPPKTPSIADPELSRDNLRQTQERITQEIDLTPAEIDTVVAEYESNLLRISDAAMRSDTPLVLMTVASNWKWLGREDLPDRWLEKIVETRGEPTESDLVMARRRIDSEIASTDRSDRYEWLFKRAVVNSRLGDWGAARRDYREAMNQDPHLRRALDSMAERVRRVARDRDHIVVDTIELLAETATNEIVGFDEFYDYVHFTPGGAVRVAGFLFDSLRDSGVIAPEAGFDSESYVIQELRRVQRTGEDSTGIDTWAGVAGQEDATLDRDLWKYDRMVQDLDRRLAKDPRDANALIHRGNAYYFELDGAEKAREHYEAALEIVGEDPVVRANLERLGSQARP